MDTKLKHKPIEETAEQDAAPLKKRRMHKALGMGLLISVFCALTLGILCLCAVNSANRWRATLYGAYGTTLSFFYFEKANEFSSEIAWRYNRLYDYLKSAELTTQKTPFNETLQGLLQESYAEIIHQVVATLLETDGETWEARLPTADKLYEALRASASWEALTQEEPSPQVYEFNASTEAVLSPAQRAQLQSELSMMQDFLFVVWDKDGNPVFTNINGADHSDEAVDALRNSALLGFSLTHPSKSWVSLSGDEQLHEKADTLRQMGYTGEIFIPYEDSNTSSMYWALRDNERTGQAIYQMQRLIPFCFIWFSGALLGGLLLLRKSFQWALGYWYGWYLKQWLFIKLLLTFFIGIVLFALVYQTGQYYLYWEGFLLLWFSIPFFLYVLMVLYLTLSFIYIVSVIRSGGRTLAHEGDIRIFKWFMAHTRLTFQTRQFQLIACFLIIVSLIPALAVICMFTLDYISYEPGVGIFIFLLCGLGGLMLGIFLQLVFAYAQMTVYSEDMACGRDPDSPVPKGWYGRPLQNLSRINEGMRRAVDEAIRSERLKSELVTNVSHDLKTPLTSIINYVALLKETPVAQTPIAAEYLEVIDKKTQRLQILIDDLFEAAKLNSGSVVLLPEEVNIIDLLKQALGELDEKIAASGVIFKCRFSEECMICWLDGKKLWRVFENLIGNIIKYAPTGSRAYITVDKTDGTVVITFKNVSNYALDFDTEELFERFKRGDASRATEGSGLGLSIARSIVTQSGGTLHIATDGDLFKAVMVFPCQA